MNEKIICVVGLGYVGLPLAAKFSEHYQTIGFDCNSAKIEKYKQGIDPTNELGESISDYNIRYTSNLEDIKDANFYVVAVPTPINNDKTPNLDLVKSASEFVGKYLGEGDIVVYESTVYPGVTEDICVPILENASNLSCGKEFFVGYSPERINPADKVHKLNNITKIVSGCDENTLKTISEVYQSIIETIYPVSSIKVAEAAKLAENTQRDINIAFMNELAMAFNLMGIDTNEVVRAMNTKWNALGFTAGLVGGHCIGVDPYYFIYQSENLGFHSQIITAARRINNNMSQYIVGEIIKEIICHDIDVRYANIYLMGMTFKENCPDTRNSRSLDIYKEFKKYTSNVYACDPYIDKNEYKKETGINLVDFSSVSNADCLVFLVGHDKFKKLSPQELTCFYHESNKLLIDVKSIFDKEKLEKNGFGVWSL